MSKEIVEKPNKEVKFVKSDEEKLEEFKQKSITGHNKLSSKDRDKLNSDIQKLKEKLFPVVEKKRPTVSEIKVSYCIERVNGLECSLLKITTKKGEVISCEKIHSDVKILCIKKLNRILEKV